MNLRRLFFTTAFNFLFLTFTFEFSEAEVSSPYIFSQNTRGVYFDGTDTQTVTVNHRNSFDVGTGDFTVAWWQKISSADKNSMNGKSPRLFQFGEGFENSDGFAISEEAGYLYLWLNSASHAERSGVPPILSAELPSSEEWVHIAIVRNTVIINGAPVHQRISIFINGSFMNSCEGICNSNGLSASQNAPTLGKNLKIGAGGNGSNVGAFVGEIIGFEFYDFAKWTSDFAAPTDYSGIAAGRTLLIYPISDFTTTELKDLVTNQAISFTNNLTYGRSTPDPSPSPTPTDSPSPSPTPTDSPSPSPTPTDSPSPSPTPTDSPSPSPTPTDSPSPIPEQNTFSLTIIQTQNGGICYEIIDGDSGCTNIQAEISITSDADIYFEPDLGYHLASVLLDGKELSLTELNKYSDDTNIPAGFEWNSLNWRLEIQDIADDVNLEVTFERNRSNYFEEPVFTDTSTANSNVELGSRLFITSSDKPIKYNNNDYIVLEIPNPIENGSGRTERNCRYLMSAVNNEFGIYSGSNGRVLELNLPGLDDIFEVCPNYHQTNLNSIRASLFLLFDLPNSINEEDLYGQIPTGIAESLSTVTIENIRLNLIPSPKLLRISDSQSDTVNALSKYTHGDQFTFHLSNGRQVFDVSVSIWRPGYEDLACTFSYYPDGNGDFKSWLGDGSYNTSANSFSFNASFDLQWTIPSLAFFDTQCPEVSKFFDRILYFEFSDQRGHSENEYLDDFLSIALRAEPRIVPDLSNLNVENAEELLLTSGLLVGEKYRLVNSQGATSSNHGKVKAGSQSISAGSSISSNSLISFSYYHYVAPTPIAESNSNSNPVAPPINEISIEEQKRVAEAARLAEIARRAEAERLRIAAEAAERAEQERLERIRVEEQARLLAEFNAELQKEIEKNGGNPVLILLNEPELSKEAFESSQSPVSENGKTTYTDSGSQSTSNTGMVTAERKVTLTGKSRYYFGIKLGGTFQMNLPKVAKGTALKLSVYTPLKKSRLLMATTSAKTGPITTPKFRPAKSGKYILKLQIGNQVKRIYLTVQN